MSGVEAIAGLVLGVLPLIIKAVESYKKIGDVVATYRKYSKAVHIFSAELSTQKAIFQNECTLLLADVVDDRWLLHEMFSESTGAERGIRLSLGNNRNLERKLSVHMNRRIGNSYEQLVVLLGLIAQNLEEIYEDTKQYQSLPDRESTDFRAWVHKVRLKFRFSIEKTALQDKIGRLDIHNRNLLAMSRQIGQFKDFRSVSEQEQNSSLVQKGLNEVCQIREASLELCSALNSLWSCQEHSEHSANLRLGLDLGGSTSIPASKIHFNVMVTNWAIDSCDGLKKPVELFIESSLELISERENQTAIVAGHSRSHLVGLISDSYNKASGQIDPIELDPQGLQGSSIPSQSGDPLQLIDLCTGSTNLCKHFHKKPEAGNASTCLGYLSGFVVYRNPPKNHTFSGAIPMARIFSRKYGNHKMNPLDKWRLAGALSRAVLQYHSTPWLRETWMDKDIFFFEKEQAEGSGSLESPHLHLFRPTNDDTNKTVSAINDDQSIKNKTLFQLGTTLLELEFEDSLEAIVERWNTTLPSTEHMTISLSDRLLAPKRHAGESLGIRYGRIVRMCLDCDFGLGLSEYSLTNKALQKAFYLQTVCEFEKLLPNFEKIYGDPTS